MILVSNMIEPRLIKFIDCNSDDFLLSMLNKRINDIINKNFNEILPFLQSINIYNQLLINDMLLRAKIITQAKENPTFELCISLDTAQSCITSPVIFSDIISHELYHIKDSIRFYQRNIPPSPAIYFTQKGWLNNFHYQLSVTRSLWTEYYAYRSCNCFETINFQQVLQSLTKIDKHFSSIVAESINVSNSGFEDFNQKLYLYLYPIVRYFGRCDYLNRPIQLVVDEKLSSWYLQLYNDLSHQFSLFDTTQEFNTYYINNLINNISILYSLYGILL